MSVQSQIDRIEQNVDSTYDVLEQAGATMPQTRNSNNLAETAASISAVLYNKAQSLTAAQKAQARANLSVVGTATPQDYGAKGNGTTDDTAAFQNALANNRVVFVPGGEYKLSAELIIGNNCQLELAQDAVLYFTQTTGNCISLKMCSWLKGNHATVSVPYGFTGNVINIDTGYSDDLYDTPPFTHWDPVWKAGRYVTDLNIVKPNSYGLNYSDNGECSGVGVHINTDGNDTSTYLWGIDLSGLRIAGAFTYGVYGITSNMNGDSGWNHDMKLGGLISGCETGVKLVRVNKVYLATMIQPQKSRTGVAYAKCGIYLDSCKYANLIDARTFDWNSNFTKWAEGNENQHIVMMGNCMGAILEDWNYYAVPGYDIRSLIYTDTPSNHETLTILQEPFTRWFKPIDHVPYFNDGNFNEKLVLQQELDEIVDAERTANFTNSLSSAIDTNGSAYNSIGYNKGVKLTLADGSTSVNESYGCTGFIPNVRGKTIYTHGLALRDGDNTTGIVLYDANFNRLAHASIEILRNAGSTGYWYRDYEATEKGFKFTIPSNGTTTNVYYVRISFHRTQIGDNAVVSVGNPITYSQSGYLTDGIKVKSQNVEGLSEILGSYIDDVDALLGGG